MTTQTGGWSSPASMYSLVSALLTIHIGSWLIAIRLPQGTQSQQKKFKTYITLLACYILCITYGVYSKQHIFPLTVYQISSTSMLPTLLPDDIIVVDTSASIQKGDVTVFLHPSLEGMYMVKRVNHQQQNQWEVLGDNPKNSIDSRVFGYIDKDSIVGKATLIIRNGHIRMIPEKTVNRSLD